ncbi:MAG: hypothetical protein AAFZ17_05930 [Cyanobacteria bacterium J06650_10]
MLLLFLFILFVTVYGLSVFAGDFDRVRHQLSESSFELPEVSLKGSLTVDLLSGELLD